MSAATARATGVGVGRSVGAGAAACTGAGALITAFAFPVAPSVMVASTSPIFTFAPVWCVIAESASPATGFLKTHQFEQQQLVDEAYAKGS